MTRTFVDAGVLIAAARGSHAVSERAMSMLDDPEREFVSSVFVQLEVLPKALFNRQQLRRSSIALFSTQSNSGRIPALCASQRWRLRLNQG